MRICRLADADPSPCGYGSVALWIQICRLCGSESVALLIRIRCLDLHPLVLMWIWICKIRLPFSNILFLMTVQGRRRLWWWVMTSCRTWADRRPPVSGACWCAAASTRPLTRSRRRWGPPLFWTIWRRWLISSLPELVCYVRKKLVVLIWNAFLEQQLIYNAFYALFFFFKLFGSSQVMNTFCPPSRPFSILSKYLLLLEMPM